MELIVFRGASLQKNIGLSCYKSVKNNLQTPFFTIESIFRRDGNAIRFLETAFRRDEVGLQKFEAAPQNFETPPCYYNRTRSVFIELLLRSKTVVPAPRNTNKVFNTYCRAAKVETVESRSGISRLRVGILHGVFVAFHHTCGGEERQ